MVLSLLKVRDTIAFLLILVSLYRIARECIMTRRQFSTGTIKQQIKRVSEN